MAKKSFRRIVVDGEVYLWHRRHSHLKDFELSPCVETLTVYPQDSKRGYLRIRFREEDNRNRSDRDDSWHAGYPQSGVLWLCQPDTPSTTAFNLNRPRVVAAVIRLLRTTRWNLTEARTPVLIENGIQFLDMHYQALQDMIERPGIQTKQTRDEWGFVSEQPASKTRT